MTLARLKLLGILCCIVIGFCTAAHAEPLFKANDRIVFYGDSITQQKLYTRYIQQYLLCRYPEMKLTFINAGWSGDTAPGGANRLERDVLALNPTLVTIFFGMNDGRYRTPDQGVTNTFKSGLDKVVASLKAKGVRVVVFSPGCVDEDRRKNLADAGYNKTLEGLATAAEDVAKKNEVTYGDVFHPMLDFQTKQKAKDSKFTMIPDAVHPNAAGHLVMAQIMLKILGAEPMPAYGTLNVADGKTTELQLLSKTDSQWVVEVSGYAPFWIEPGSREVAAECGMLDFATPTLAIKGLGDKPYNVLNAKNQPLGRYSASDLDAGITLAGDNPDAGKQLHDLIALKEEQYFQAWRNVYLPFGKVEGGADSYKNMLAANESLGLLAQSLAKPMAKTKLTVASVDTTGNIALKCKYESSDPNRFNWGIGGLTDGSWIGSNTTCFATGDSGTFPKHATVDLGSTFKINQVIFGVPNFGSTKTVKVSISKDNKTFTDVGSYQFSQKKEEKTTIKFDAADARYVRLTYVDKYPEQVGYAVNFGFTTELEVYASK